MAEINKRKAGPKIASSIDIHCEIQAVPFAALSEMKPGEPSEKIRERVIKASPGGSLQGFQGYSLQRSNDGKNASSICRA